MAERRKRRRSWGFTLFEVLLVLVVLGVLAGIAVPMYQGTVEEARSAEAKANLQTIYMAQKVFNIDHGEYYPAGGGAKQTTNASDLKDINDNLKVDLSPNYYNLVIDSTGKSGKAENYTATATRTSNPAKEYSIDEQNGRKPPF